MNRKYYYALCSDCDLEIAQLDKRTGTALRRLDEINSVTYELVADLDDLLQHIKLTKINKKDDSNLEIVIYGPRAQKHEVGKALSVEKFYLQRPWRPTLSVDFDNPHMISFLDMLPDSNQNQAPMLAATPGTPSCSRQDLLESLRELDQKQEIDSIHVDPCIRTSLLEYAFLSLCTE